MDPEQRTKYFRRNPDLESLLAEIAADLTPVDESLIAHYKDKACEFPIMLVMAPLRSGTTLFMQWLANTGVVAYPSNFLSRFYYAPILGAKLQLLLMDPRYRFRDELDSLVTAIDYVSENGKTSGALSPNEFWYFWRRFLPKTDRDQWTDAELRRHLDIEPLKAELTGLTSVFRKPFAAKGILFNYNIALLDSILDRALFVRIMRDPVATAASILEARERQLGSVAEWYSFRIPEFERLKTLEPVEQVAGQVYYINEAISRGLSRVSAERKLVIAYEDFCQAPGRAYEQLLNKLNVSQPTLYTGPPKFEVARHSSIPNATAIRTAFESFTDAQT